MRAKLARWWGQRYLVRQLVRREVAQRYRGSLLGGVWQILTPLLMLAVYTWIFSVVFQAKWGKPGAGSGSHQIDFALNVFAGMLFLQVFVDTLSRAPSLITSNANYVKKVVFPLAVLPVVNLFASLFQFGVGLVIWGTFYFAVHHTLHPAMMGLPLILLPFLLLTLGLAWFLSATGAYIRDIGPAMQMVLTLLTFVSPVFYPLDILPEALQAWLVLNPLSFIIEQGRAAMIQGLWPDLPGLLVYALVSGVVAVAGYAWFGYTRQGFADVL